ncbi:MAG: hypothetical protein E6Q97_03540 [Desulfurellales bacterium]|nr:MAG: hypothetical protein E6Q97_03540 [Desulfurellales bacterium]
MTDTPRVTDHCFKLWLKEAKEKAAVPCVFLSWRDRLMLDLDAARALAQSQAATIAALTERLARAEAALWEAGEQLALLAKDPKTNWAVQMIEAARKEALEDAAKVVAANMTLDLSSMRDPPSESTGWNDAVRSCVAAIRAMKEPT